MTGFPLLAGIPIEVREQESALFAGDLSRGSDSTTGVGQQTSIPDTEDSAC
jgi:hypothetical protein